MERAAQPLVEARAPVRECRRRPAQVVPWRVRQAGGRWCRSTVRTLAATLRLVGLAWDRDTDRPRPWAIPPLSICHPKPGAFRNVFSRQDYELPAIRRISDSLEQCARATRTTLDRSKRWEIPVLVSGSNLAAGDVCLDVGCGSSCLPIWLDGIGCEVFAVDPEMPGVAREWSLPTHRIRVNRRFINYLRRSVLDLPFADGTFDHVFCVSVLEHLPAACLPQALAELSRVVRPGGTLAISTDLFPARQASIPKEHAQVFDLDRLHRALLAPLSAHIPVAPINLTIAEGLEQHLADVRRLFNARHSFFAAVWRTRPTGALPSGSDV